ncbi:MAG: ABC transporter substrate-binding protein [Tsuneonella sp.]
MRTALAGLAMLAGCAPTAPPRAASEHPTIVSLNPCTDAILAEVADPGQIAALSRYSQDPRQSSMDVNLARRFPATGGTVEEVLALAPDVVVGSSFIDPATRAALGRLGMRVETVGIASTVADSEAQVRDLARLAGHPERGEALVTRIEAALASARSPRQPIPAVLWQPDGIVPGDHALVSELMRRAGFANQSAARGMGQADYLSLERLLADPPRVLLVAGSERGQHHPALTALRGVTRASLDPALLYCAGPTIIRATERLAEVRRAVIKPLPFRGGGGVGHVARAAQPPPPAPPLKGTGGI